MATLVLLRDSEACSRASNRRKSSVLPFPLAHLPRCRLNDAWEEAAAI